MIRYMSLVAVAAVATMFIGYAVYIAVWAALHPSVGDDLEPWTSSDTFMLGGILFASLTVAASIGWRLGRRFIGPLHAMGEAAQAVATGNFNVRVDGAYDGMGEIEDLIDNFNTMAELLERAQADLAYQNSAIAHELRTPLTILRGRLQGLSDGVFEPSPQMYGGLIAHVDALTRIVDDLRTLALFKAGQMALKLEPFDLGQEVSVIVEGLEAEFERADIVATLRINRLPIIADRARIRQIMLALLDNTCRYAGGSTLRILVQERKGDGVIEIEDNGPGLADQEVSHVFERFWRADESRARSKGGSGLGLSIVRAVVEAHGGSAIAMRNPSGGLTFTIALPLHREGHRHQP